MGCFCCVQQETWTCPAGTEAYYYLNQVPIPYAGGYAVCYPPPNSVWYQSDGTTPLNIVACQSEPLPGPPPPGAQAGPA
ncbi:hypothetical protein OESDEN_05805 [Oesophagostomum dentatum]|uniref:Uncharacterized protein n=1 Tax=Oesophagostomum dentatum TaxID=61180 RepID=A0A0B1T9N7_OESDE|nr:hypothetical protein OESDEN_05805 [Oesophagostomum dentatum]